MRIATLWIGAIIPLLFTLTACQSTEPAAEQDRPLPLLLISIDGMRYDYLDLVELPAIQRLVDGGVTADSLQHVFPTKTFPTHYSMVTGCHPGTHGVVANRMWDRERDAEFSLGNREAVSDGFWYQACEPIWVAAENQGLRAGTFFWPGSEARIRGVRPSFWVPYSDDLPHRERVETLLEWLDLPAAERPTFLTLYFSVVDSMGHRHGPLAESVAAALVDVDQHLGILFDGLEERGLFDQMHIILASDHGMTRVDTERTILLDEFLDLSRVVVSDWGPAAQIWATDMAVDEIVSALEGAHPRMRVWAREDIPARYRFGRHSRVPDVVAEADLAWLISNRPFQAGQRRFPLLGQHGWDPALREMHSVLLLHGPGFEAGGQIPSVRSVDLYPLMTYLLGLEPASEHEGSLTPWLGLFELDGRPQIEHRAYDCQGEILKARIGPAHMGLHVGDFLHVLERVDADSNGAVRFADVDLSFESDGRTASARIDGRAFNNCPLVMADR
ncbi:MAG: alkaline phosphatase family protein [Wenzhouxiangella sp.]